MSPPGDEKARGLSPAAGWAAVLVVWLTLQSALAALVTAFPQHATDLWLLGACELLVLGGASLAIARRRPVSLVDGLAAGSPAGRALLYGLALGLAMHPVADALRNVVETVSPTPSELLERKLAVLNHETLARTLRLFAVVGVAGPFVEELFYRGALYTSIESRAGVRWAAIVTSVGFVFAHGDVRDWPSLALVAVVLTRLRSRTTTIWASVACHVAFNGSTLLWAVLGRHGAPGGWVTVALAGILAAGLLAKLSHTTRGAT